MRYDLYMPNKEEEKREKVNAKIQQLHREAEEEKAKNLADKLGFSYIDLRISPIDEYALILAKKEEALNAKAAIIQKRHKELYVVTLDPQLEQTKTFINALENQGYRVKVFITSQSNIKRAWAKYDILKTKTVITKKAEIDTEQLKEIQSGISTIKDLEEKIEKSKSSATDLLNVIIAAGMKLQTSDIHIEVISKEEVRLRFRIDGTLQDAGKVPLSAFKLLLSRVKMLSGLKLNVHDTPQDGRFTFNSEGSDIEIRTSTIPAEYGENVVFRVLDPKTIGFKMEDLGIQEYDYKVIEKELQKPNGMIITCGPTGSGKTTLLYAFLKKVNSPEIKIITLEDPIEYHLEGVEQTQVSEGNEAYTFANGLRSIVRQDPDIIMVGEIRDEETSGIAIQAALTGHMVFSTLHTNDASGAIPRLIDMKINPSLIPPALNLIIAQRLIRRVCLKCAEEVEANKEEIEKIKAGLENLPNRVKKPAIDNIKIKKASEKGCPECNFSGYKGRTGIFELFVIDDQMEKVILKTPSFVEIKEAAVKAGMVTMKQDGLLKVLQGITTLDEVEKVMGE